MNYLQLLRRYPNYIAYGALHFFFSSPGQTFFISLFVLYFTQELSISHIDFDWLYSGGTLLSAAVLPFVGKWVDEIKLRYFSIGLAICFALVCVGVANFTSIYLLFFLIFGLRLCGQGLMCLTANTAIGRYFHNTRGKALSLINFGVSIGESVLPPLVVLLIAAVGWRNSWWVISETVLLVFLPLVIGLVKLDSPFQIAPEDEEEEKPDAEYQAQSSKSKTRAEALREPRFYFLVLISLFMPFFSTGVMINSSIVGDSYGWSMELVALSISAFGFARLSMNFLSGWLIDTFSGIWVFGLQLVPLIPGLALMLFFPNPTSWLIFFILMGVSASLNSLSGTATWAEIYGTRYLGSIRSLASTFGVFSTAAAPIILGFGLADIESQQWTFIISIAVMVLLSLLGIALARRRD